MSYFQSVIKGRPPFRMCSVIISESKDLAYEFMAADVPNRWSIQLKTYRSTVPGNLHFVYTCMTSVYMKIASYE